MNESAFEAWWQRIGQTIDPDTEDVSWYDKRKGLAAAAFQIGMAAAMNYVADHEVFPQEITFAGGRSVVMKGGGHLFVRTKS